MAAIRLTLAQARRSWLTRQRLVAAPSDRPRTLAETVADIGWIPMPSGATPYLSLFARGALATRAELDELVCKRAELSVVPGPRGSSWLVPTSDAPLARAFAVADHASREARVASSTTLTSRDLQGARDALRAALSTPATADEIKARIPEAFLRSLGDAGRKNGVPTLAALVLRSMWVTGEVMRIPAEGRVDRGVVQWGIDPRPRTVPTAADAVDAIAARWLAAHAPISPRAFATAFGIAAGRANAALKPLRAVEVEIEGLEGAYVAPADFAPLDPALPLSPQLLPLRDPLTDAQLTGLATPAVARLALARTPGAAPAVLVDGEVVGTWQFDEVARLVTWRSLGPEVPPTVAAEVDAVAYRLATFIANELGTAALHTPPTPRSRLVAGLNGDELSIEI